MYESGPTIQKTTWQTEPAAPVPESSTPGTLLELAAAAKAYAEASDMFITARRNHGFAKARYEEMLNMVAKNREQEGV